MVVETRNAPTFSYDVQKQLWDIRREYAILSGFYFSEAIEEKAIDSLSVEDATAAVAEAELKMAAFKKKVEAKKKRKGKQPAQSPPESDPEISEKPANEGEGKPSDDSNDRQDEEEIESDPGNEESTSEKKKKKKKPKRSKSAADSDPSDPEDSSDDDEDDRNRTSRGDKAKIRGRTPRIEVGTTSKKKVFKTEPPKKYTGEKDKERTYDAVQLYLSQLSRYLRISTEIDMKADISEYVAAFLDGFAYKWFNNLKKPDKAPYLWEDFEAAMRKKFIPLAHIEQAITKYLAIEQTDGKSVSEYIVEREDMETTLGDAITDRIIKSSFRKGLHRWLREKMSPFSDLSHEEYVRKVEVLDQDAREQKVGPYAPKKGDSKDSKSSTSSKSYKRGNQSGSAGDKGSGNAGSSKSEKDTGKKQMSKKEMRQKGICYNCYEKGHIASDCPHPRRDGKTETTKQGASPEANSIRIKPQPTKNVRKPMSNQQRDGRKYSDVVTGKASLPDIPAIGLKEESSAPTNSVAKPKPMFATLEINGVKSKSLIDTGSSDDFIGTHFATVNRLSVKNRETPVTIQQAIKGSKPKTNATTTVGIKFGEWTKKLEAHVAGLAGYDAIIGVPTLTDGDAVIDVTARTVYFRAWDFTLHCEMPEEPLKPPKKNVRWMGGQKRNSEKKPGSRRQRKLKNGQKPVVSMATTSITTSPTTQSFEPKDVDKNGSPTYYRNLLLEEFDDVLVDELPNELPPLREINHRIPYKPTKPWIAHKYRLPEAHKQALEEDVKAKLDSGILRFTSDIPLAASHMVPKHEIGKFRHVQDLRKRNEDTESMSWPMPDQEELVNKVAQSSHVSIGDMISAFDQTRIDPRDEKYATIINHMGILQQRTVQQGDKNSVATQQRTMQHHLREYWGKNVTVYVDDMPIYDEKPGMSAYSHFLACRCILLTLRKNKFYLNRKKTKFFIDMEKDGVDVLGRHIQNGEISIAKPKVDAFLALQSPTSHQELGKDLGTFNWLTDHLPWAATIAAPLQELYHSAKWEWREVHEKAFTRMKELIAGAEVLVPLDLSAEAVGNAAKKIFVVSDSSLSGGGGYICQGESFEDARPAVYHSRVFNPAQTNYPVHEQELLALVDLIKSYEHWLLGRPFTAVTDSQAMLSLMKQKFLSPRQWRAMTYLSKFDMKFEFIPGKKNIIADLLSRIAERSTYKHDLPYLSEDDEESAIAAIQLRRGKTLLEVPLIKKRTSNSRSTPTVEAESTPTSEAESTTTAVIFDLSNFREAIIKGYEDDTQFKKALKEGVESRIYVLKDGLLYTGPDRKQLCIPDVKVKGGRDGGEKNLREMLIAHCHESTIGHLGSYKTAARLHEEFYWKTSTTDVQKYVKSCHLCQTKKTSPTKQYGKNHPLPVPDKPWEQVSMDFLVNLPSSALNEQKYNSLFVVEDMLSHQAHLIPTTTTVKAEGVAKLYFDQIYRLHGLPRAIVSDRDTKFTGAFWRTLQKMVGTDLMMSTTDHPQTDGLTERTNRTVLQILRMFVNQVGSDWTQHLAAVEFAINSAVSRATGKAPFEIVYGYLPRSFPPIAFDQDNPASMEFMENRMLAQLSAQDAIIAAKTEQSYYVNKHRKEDPNNITTGQDVVVSNESQLSHLPKGRQKLATKWVGPYKVIKTDKSKSNYTIEIPNSKRHPTFHVSYVKQYTDPHLELFPNRQRRRPRIVTSEVDLNIEVEKIIGHQKRRDGSIYFLSLWEGYPAEDATFRDAELFKTSPYGIKVIEDYLKTFGDLPEELAAWIEKADWIKFNKIVTEATGVVSKDSMDKEETDEEDSEEINALWLMLELEDVVDDADAWSEEGRM